MMLEARNDSFEMFEDRRDLKSIRHLSVLNIFSVMNFQSVSFEVRRSSCFLEKASARNWYSFWASFLISKVSSSFATHLKCYYLSIPKHSFLNLVVELPLSSMFVDPAISLN